MASSCEFQIKHKMVKEKIMDGSILDLFTTHNTTILVVIEKD